MPWAKGQSGNPTGRPRASPEVRRVRALAQEASEEALIALQRALHDDEKYVAAAKEILRLAGAYPPEASEDYALPEETTSSTADVGQLLKLAGK